MTDEGWKQSAVMFYAAGTILTIISFTSCILYHIYKNADRRRRLQQMCCYCCVKDPMVAYDSVSRGDESPTEEDNLLEEETVFTISDEGDVNEGDIELNNKVI